MIDTGFGIEFENINVPEGAGIVIRNNLARMERIVKLNEVYFK